MAATITGRHYKCRPVVAARTAERLAALYEVCAAKASPPPTRRAPASGGHIILWIMCWWLIATSPPDAYTATQGSGRVSPPAGLLQQRCS
jgi:hypothetical protein